jgi:hypothetical protein
VLGVAALYVNEFEVFKLQLGAFLLFVQKMNEKPEDSPARALSSGGGLHSPLAQHSN